MGQQWPRRRSSGIATTGDEIFDHTIGPNLISWADPGSWTDVGGSRKRSRPGLGKFLFKVGGRPGIPVALKLTSVEKSLHDTNKRWTISNTGEEDN